MAGRSRRQSHTASSNHRRVNSKRSETADDYRLESYEDGSAVRILAPEDPYEEEIPEKRVHVSSRTRRNRARAKAMSAGYVIFLAAVCVMTVFVCIKYLRLRAELTTQTETIAAMESDLSQLQADNDAYYKAARASLSMEDVKNTAINKLGMHYATESQIRYYNADDESYVRQYENVSADK